MKRYLVTGGAGFIGSNVSRLLKLRDNADVIIVDNMLTGSVDNLAGIEFELLDIGVETKDWFNKVHDFGVEGILHLASITDTTITDWKIMRSNTDGFKRILEFATRYSLPVVYASSASVYGDGPTPMVETQKRIPLNIYAESKAQLEDLAKEASSSLPKLIGLRYFNVFGENEKFKGKAASMVTQLYNQVISGKKPRLFKFGEQKRDYIYVKDVANITIHCIQNKVDSDILNVGRGEGVSFNQLVESASDALGLKTEIEYFDNPFTGKYQSNTVANVAVLSRTVDLKKFSTIESVYQKWAAKR